MIITNEKFEVTQKMMENANMTRGSQLGIPIDPKDRSKGLKWGHYSDLEDSDFDKLEEYFLIKSKH